MDISALLQASIFQNFDVAKNRRGARRQRKEAFVDVRYHVRWATLKHNQPYQGSPYPSWLKGRTTDVEAADLQSASLGSHGHLMTSPKPATRQVMCAPGGDFATHLTKHDKGCRVGARNKVSLAPSQSRKTKQYSSTSLVSPSMEFSPRDLPETLRVAGWGAG